MELFAADGVLNGIGDVVAQQSFEGALLSGLIVYLADLLPDIHRALKKISVSGDVVCIQLTIQGTFLGPLQTPAARSSRRGPRSPSRPPTSGICATARSRCSTATLLSPPCTRSSAYCRTTRPHSASNASFHVPRAAADQREQELHPWGTSCTDGSPGRAGRAALGPRAVAGGAQASVRRAAGWPVQAVQRYWKREGLDRLLNGRLSRRGGPSAGSGPRRWRRRRLSRTQCGRTQRPRMGRRGRPPR